MPRVLIVCEYPTLNGGEHSMLSVLEGTRRAGFEIVVATPAAGPLAESLSAEGVQVLSLRMTDSGGKRLPRQTLENRLRSIIKSCRPALVHANSLAMSRLSGPVVERLGNASIGHLRDILGLTPAAVADLNRHTRLLAVSHATRDYHVAAGLDQKKTFVLHNGVDLARFRPRGPSGYLHRELNLPPSAPLVAAIGQISLRKGLDVLVEAAAMVASKLPCVHFLIVGGRHSQKQEAQELEAVLRRKAGQAMLAGRCHFLGVRTDVDRLLNELTLLVHAACQEPLGRVLLEAAAAGTAVLATDVGGTSEIFPNGASEARLVPPGDVAALASAMVEILEDEPLRRRLAAAARHRAEEAFDAQAAGRGLADHYHQVLGSFPAAYP